MTALSAHPRRSGRPPHPARPGPTADPDQRHLAGAAASDLPGTALAPGQSVLSVVDAVTKLVDAYNLALSAGQTLRVQLGATPAEAVVLLLPPGTAPFLDAPDAASGAVLCNGVIAPGPCDKTFPIAKSGASTLVVEAGAPGMLYTVQATAT